jgi:hypothetical protein
MFIKYEDVIEAIVSGCNVAMAVPIGDDDVPVNIPHCSWDIVGAITAPLPLEPVDESKIVIEGSVVYPLPIDVTVAELIIPPEDVVSEIAAPIPLPVMTA